MKRTYCITLDKERADYIEKEAEKMGVPAATYLRRILEQNITTPESKPSYVDYPTLLQNIYECIKKTKLDPAKNGEFCLRDIEEFRKLCIVSAQDGKVSVETVRASVGRQWNCAIKYGRFAGISRAKTEHGALKFINGAAVYKKEG